MFHRTAAYYRDYEDKRAAQVIGDQYECTRLYIPASISKMAPDGTPGERQRLAPDQRMESITRAHEILVFCLSLLLNDVLRNEFEAVACVGLVRAVNPQPVDIARAHARQIAVPDLIGVFRQGDALALGFAAGIKQADLNLGGVSRKHRKVGTLAIPDGSLGRRTAFSDTTRDALGQMLISPVDDSHSQCTNVNTRGS